MSKVFESIDDKLRAFIEQQKMFFVATSPLSGEGHINLSPKGLPGTFAVLDRRTVAYLDLTGSGVETIAHLRENGRICLMFCAFEGRPKICRLHGRGIVQLAGAAGFDALAVHFADHDGRRSIVEVEVERVSSSCGFGVPLMDYVGQRDELTDWTRRKQADDGLPAYWARRNALSIDGLPGVVADAAQ